MLSVGFAGVGCLLLMKSVLLNSLIYAEDFVTKCSASKPCYFLSRDCHCKFHYACETKHMSDPYYEPTILWL